LLQSNSTRALLAHYKKFTVSTVGAIVLVKELTRYQELFSGYSPDLDEKFDGLRDIGNLFLVKLDNVKAAVLELSKEDPNILLEYLRCREDWVDMKGLERDITESGSVGNLNQMTTGTAFMGDLKGFKM
jgi:hypothetical protein